LTIPNGSELSNDEDVEAEEASEFVAVKYLGPPQISAAARISPLLYFRTAIS
jgi:hypothetical protein